MMKVGTCTHLHVPAEKRRNLDSNGATHALKEVPGYVQLLSHPIVGNSYFGLVQGCP